MAAADHGKWNVVKAVLSFRCITSKEASYIFSKATKYQQWSLIANVALKCKPLHADILQPLLDNAYDDGEWYVIGKILSQAFRYKRECLNRILLKTVEDRNWERVKEVLKMMKYSKEHDADLVNAALSEDSMACKTFIDNNQYDRETVDTSVVVISAGGTSDEVASMMMINGSYSAAAQQDILFLSALNGNMEFLQDMFAKNTGYRFTYQSLSRAQKAAGELGHHHVKTLLTKIMEKESENLTRNY